MNLAVNPGHTNAPQQLSCAVTSFAPLHGRVWKRSTIREMLVEMFEGIERKTDANESIKLFTSLLRDVDSGWLMAMH